MEVGVNYLEKKPSTEWLGSSYNDSQPHNNMARSEVCLGRLVSKKKKTQY